ncbi:copper homeostasis protein CutC [Agaribacter flavus]|uniref:Copper homeostasis protein cutC homolog n=1 Tax=Agaribacter flavus TaxID=1902781 RepID=A0ABV7FQ87_9ALTE
MRNVEICLETQNQMLCLENLDKLIDCGVKRVELCDNMVEDGLTPSMKTVEAACNYVDKRRFFSFEKPELVVMIRLHNADFTVTQAQLSQMRSQIRDASNAGAEGVVFGILNRSNNVDRTAMMSLCKEAIDCNLNISFHRAFDALDDGDNDISTLLEMGVKRLLSSGTPWQSKQNATIGLYNLNRILKKLPKNRQLIVGGGVNVNNASIIESNLIKSATHTKQLWLHAYSGVLSDNKVCPKLTRQLVNNPL